MEEDTPYYRESDREEDTPYYRESDMEEDTPSYRGSSGRISNDETTEQDTQENGGETEVTHKQ